MESTFTMHQKEKGELIFRRSNRWCTVTPSGRFEVKWDEHGQLIYFIHHGPFLAKKALKAEKYTLPLIRLKNLAQQQVQRFEWPSFEHNKIRPIYALEEVYVKNDGTGTFRLKLT